MYKRQLLYTTYKRYDLNQYTWDSRHYMAMVDSIVDNNVKGPWKYRVVTPLLVNLVEKYNLELNF